MFSKNEYDYFKSTLEPIIQDTFVKEPTKEEFMKNKYYIQTGLWEGTQDMAYAYDREKVDSHIDTFLSMLKKVPLLEKPSQNHGGIIFCIDFLENFKARNIPADEMRSQIFLANHFINFLTLTKITKPFILKMNNNQSLALAIDPKYRSFFEHEGQEPADD